MSAFRPEHFRDLAGKLNVGGPSASSEARHRTVAGRCYYATYLAVSSAMYDQHGILRSAFRFPEHFALAHELSQKKHGAEVNRIGTALASLLARRHSADYDLDVATVEDDADESIADAKRVADLLTPAVIKCLPLLTGKAK